MQLEELIWRANDSQVGTLTIQGIAVAEAHTLAVTGLHDHPVQVQTPTTGRLGNPDCLPANNVTVAVKLPTLLSKIGVPLINLYRLTAVLQTQLRHPWPL
jgi:hypothetical protein